MLSNVTWVRTEFSPLIMRPTTIYGSCTEQFVVVVGLGSRCWAFAAAGGSIANGPLWGLHSGNSMSTCRFHRQISELQSLDWVLIDTVRTN